MEKTPFHFDAPITGIVGPNGCGKSNVVDALKWVTGELSYKELRGKNSEDLIFAGSDRRPPSSMMEVNLTLDNSDQTAPPQYNQYSEITVTRRIFRDGSSEFAINKTPCRLRDITDMFLDTGIGQSSYSIIEQGKVGAIVSGRPEDRRLMIEEAAGITKYKHRKKAAQRKMDSTKQNLLRVTDIVTELEKRIASLERQAKKAEKFRVLKQEFETLDLELSGHEFEAMDFQKKDLLDQDQTMQDVLIQMDTQLSNQETEFEKQRLILEDLEKTFQHAQQELFSQKSSIQKMDHDLETAKHEIDRSQKQKEIDTQSIQALSQTMVECQERLDAIKQELNQIEADKSAIQTDLENKQTHFQGHRENLQGLETSLDEAKKQHVQAVTLKAQSKSQLQSIQDNIHSTQAQMGEVKEELVSLADEITSSTQEVQTQKKLYDEVQQLCFGFQENQQSLEDQLADHEAKKEELEKEIETVTRSLQTKESKLEALEDFTKNYQGYDQTVQNIMRKRNQDGAFPEVQGVMGETLHIEPGFEKAVQAVLSDWIEGIVVNGVDSASDLFDYLHNQQPSRALLLDGQFQATKVETPIQDENILGTLDQWVTFEDQKSPAAVISKLKQANVVGHWSHAIALHQQYPNHTFVTQSGDLIQDHGLMHVGPWNDTHGDLEVRQEMDQLQQDIAPLKKQKEQLSYARQEAVTQFQKVKNQLAQLHQDMERENQKSSEMGRTLQKMTDALEFSEKRKADASHQLEVLQKKLTDFEEKKGQVIQDLEQATQTTARLETTIEETTQAYQSSRADFDRYQEEIHQYQIKLTSFLEKMDALKREQTSLLQREEQARQNKTQLEASIESHAQNIVDQEKRIDELDAARLQELAAFQNKEEVNSELQIKHDQLVQDIRQIENDLKQARKAKENQVEAINTVRVALSEVAVKMEGLQAQVFEKYEKDILSYLHEDKQEDQIIEITSDNLESLQSKREELKGKLSRFGNVNLAAIDEIEELQERYTFLTEQRADLETSLASLTDAIKTINKTTKEKFETAYAEVDARFQKIFPRLFRGGKARLTMNDPENILETGIDIFAQPPGKKLQNMNLLSGGEKALTAISLLFAIFEYKAPPFCVLDEVDAPLDDANVLRYVSMVKEMSQQTQFIVVTHNKGAMEMAQSLYGVTMEEPGVSRTVSVRLAQENVHNKEEIFEQRSVA
jgi:chromosome segregation protein